MQELDPSLVEPVIPGPFWKQCPPEEVASVTEIAIDLNHP